VKKKRATNLDKKYFPLFESALGVFEEKINDIFKKKIFIRENFLMNLI